MFDKIYRYPKRWALVNFLIVITCMLGIAFCVNLHAISLWPIAAFCYWDYIFFPGIILASKLVQTSVAAVRYIYIYCDVICRRCNNFYIFTNLILIIGLLVATPYLATIGLSKQLPLLTTCLFSFTPNIVCGMNECELRSCLPCMARHGWLLHHADHA